MCYKVKKIARSEPRYKDASLVFTVPARVVYPATMYIDRTYFMQQNNYIAYE